jgi:hypothetical protein
MTPEEKSDILIKAKDWFRDIGVKHVSNTVKLTNIKEFIVNPFLVGYLTYFHSGGCDPVSIAKTLIYPRVLGTSINTTFGTAVQSFTHNVLNAFASIVPGMDIEFIDYRDGIKKYAQLKAGPNTINAPDVRPMINEFDSTLRLARQNGSKINSDNLILCIVYGDPESLSGHYRNIEKRYNVIIGQEFWYALTGDKDFYYDLIDAIAEMAFEARGTDLLQQTIATLATDPSIIELSKKLQERVVIDVPATKDSDLQGDIEI